MNSLGHKLFYAVFDRQRPYGQSADLSFGLTTIA